MARPTDNGKRERIYAAATKMLSDGVVPTRRKLRECLGWGSPWLLTAALRDWRQTVLPKITDGIEASRLRQEIEALASRYEGERAHLMLETDRIRQQLSPEVANLRRRAATAESEAFLLQQKNIVLAGELHAAQRRIEELSRDED